LANLGQKEQGTRNINDTMKNEIESLKHQLTQANNYIQSQDGQFRSIQRELEMSKTSNLELKTQLEQANLRSYTAPQSRYQAPPPQYHPPPPQFEAYNQYQAPPQFVPQPAPQSYNYQPPPSSSTSTYQPSPKQEYQPK
jgi:hypothetical protein